MTVSPREFIGRVSLGIQVAVLVTISDIAGFSIRSATSNGTDTQIVYKNDLRSPEGIAIDYASRNLYYVDSIKDEIGVISIDGRYQKGLITEGLVNPRALAIDLDGRKLYYR